MKKTSFPDVRGSIFTIVFYALMVLALYINRKCVELVSRTYDYKYSDIAVASTIAVFVLLGLLLAYLAGRKQRSGATRILELIVIIIPSVLLLLSEFPFAQNSYMLPVPLFVQCYRGQLPAVGGALFGCMVFAEICSFRAKGHKA